MSAARAPRPVALHWLVDSAIAFLATAVIGFILGANIWMIVGLALVLGAAATPLTHRAEIRGLSERARHAEENEEP